MGFSVALEVSGVKFTLEPESSSSAPSFAVCDQTDTDQQICIDLKDFTGTLRIASTAAAAAAAAAAAQPNERTKTTPILKSESRFSVESSVELQTNVDDTRVRDIVDSWSSEVGKGKPDSLNNTQAAGSSVSIVGNNQEVREEAALKDDDQPSLSGIRVLDSRRGALIAKTDSERALFLGREDGSIDTDIDTGTNDNQNSATLSSRSRIGMSSSTRLHMMCTRPRIAAEDLHMVLRSNMSYASRRDPFGRYPLHVLAGNDALAASMPTEEMVRFLKELLDANPEAILALDIDGQLPFVSTVADWVDSVHTPLEDGREHSYHGVAGVDSMFATHSQNQNFNAASPSFRVFTYAFPHDVVIPLHVLWSLRMLSVVVDHLTPSPGTALWRLRTVSNLRFSIAKQTASSVPFICKTLLLVADEDEGDSIFHTPLVRTMLLYPDLVGDWLVAMLWANRSRAVDFLEEVSNVTVGDFVGRKRGFSKDEVSDFIARRKRVFDTVADLNGLVPSMLALNANTIERAASTRVITYVLDQAVKDPISLGFMLFDLILEIILVISYRIFVDGEDLVPDVVRGCGLISLTISSYFLLGECLTTVCMIATSRNMLKQFLFDFWTINDILSMALTFTSCVCKFNGINAPTLFAFTIGFLWMKILGTLKTLNQYLATFVLALVEIVKDSRWFLLILGLAIIMFADMIEIISKNSGLCGNQEDVFDESRRRLDAQADFCSPYILDSYARIYAVLVGDVSLEDFQQSGVITLLFVFFTFFGILILLSVLIAIVEDSYSRAKIKSFSLFGRARVEYVARQQIRERFLKSVAVEGRVSCWSREYAMQLLKRLIRSGVTMSVIAVALSVGALLVMTNHAVISEHRNNANIRYLDRTLGMATVLFAAFLLSLLALVIEQHQIRNNVIFRSFAAVAIVPLTVFCKFLGIDRDGHTMRDAQSTLDNEWISKLHYMTQKTKAIVDGSESRMLTELNKDIKATEERLIAQGRRNALDIEEEIKKR